MNARWRAALWALTLGGGACAQDEGYLVLEVRFPESAADQSARISVRRNSGLPSYDEFVVDAASLRRRIAIHAEDGELSAELEVQIRVCADPDQEDACQTGTLEFTHAFERGETTQLCVDSTGLEGMRISFDMRDPSAEVAPYLCD